MKTNILKSMFIVLISYGSVFAGNESNPETGLLLWAFIGFFVSVLMIQFIPAVILFGSMLKGLFSNNEVSQIKGE